MMEGGPDALSVALRAISFMLLLTSAGIPVFVGAYGRLMPTSVPAVSGLGWRLALGALVFVAAHHALEAARMTGEMSGVLDPAMQKMALLSPAGAAFAMRVLGLALITAGLRGAPGVPWHGALGSSRAAPAGVFGAAGMPSVPRLALPGSLLCVSAFTLVGHTSINPHRFVAMILLTLHLLAVAFWVGALGPLYMAATREQPPVTARVIAAFSLTAVWVVPLILLAGIGLAAMLLPGLAAFKQPYGQLLLAKVAGFAVLMAMASLNKWRFGPACAAGDTQGFKRTVLIEYVLICAVLAVTAVMTTIFSPEVA
jgi:putative copper resistance protein D